MSVVYESPGVFVEEDHSLSLSVVSGATAVPIFVCADGDLAKLGFDGDYARINSWLDVAKGLASTLAADEAKNRALEKQSNGGQTEKTKGTVAPTLIELALQTYFENGGGRCYVCEQGKLLTCVPALDDATLLVGAGCALTAAQVAMCNERTGIFGIFDWENRAIDGSSSVPAMEVYKTVFGAIYYPYLKKRLANGTEVDIPPSAAVAGVIATVDRDRGVWKAPANVALKGGLRAKFIVADAVQDQRNSADQAVNIIRPFGGDSPVVWGARTSNTQLENGRWKYIPVRRLFNAVERDIRRAMAFAVFEPNNSVTWEKVRAAIDSYLHTLWRQGAFLGAKPEEAYRIAIGRHTTMSDQDIDEGRLIVTVSLAAVRPAEFVVLRFAQITGGAAN